jgi:hypothetical protein
MHYYNVKMKDGREFSAPIWNFKPNEGYVTFTLDLFIRPDLKDLDRKVFLHEIESAYCPTERVGITDKNQAKLGEDLLELARNNGWIPPDIK